MQRTWKSRTPQIPHSHRRSQNLYDSPTERTFRHSITKLISMLLFLPSQLKPSFQKSPMMGSWLSRVGPTGFDMSSNPSRGRGVEQPCHHTFLKASYTNGKQEGNGLFSPTGLAHPNLRGRREEGGGATLHQKRTHTHTHKTHPQHPILNHGPKDGE